MKVVIKKELDATTVRVVNNKSEVANFSYKENDAVLNDCKGTLDEILQAVYCAGHNNDSLVIEVK